MSEHYLTPEELEIAESNGISRELAQNRVYRHGWDKQRAITQQRRDTKTLKWATWAATAEENGICKSTFYTRLSNGRTPEEAATQPLSGTRYGASRIFSKEILELAASNGISRARLYERVQKSNWDEHRAATTPIIPTTEIHKYRKSNKYKEKSNRIAAAHMAKKKMWADKEGSNESLAKTRA